MSENEKSPLQIQSQQTPGETQTPATRHFLYHKNPGLVEIMPDGTEKKVKPEDTKKFVQEKIKEYSVGDSEAAKANRRWPKDL